MKIAYFLFASLLLGASLPATAGDFPEKPIRLILPLAPGGITDNIARLVGQKFQEATGQALIVENKPGAGGIVASEAVARSPSDGYTLLMGNFATHAVTPTLFDKLNYDPINDFAPVTLLASSPHLLVVNPDLPAKNLKELIALGKAPGATLNYASAGVGSPLHLAGALFSAQSGINASHVPYKSSGPALTDLIAGRVQFMFDNLLTSLPHVRAGKLRAIAQTGPVRSPAAPDIPTVAELGLAGFQTYGWWGILAPAKTPPEVLAKLNSHFLRIIQSPDVQSKLAEQGVDTLGKPRDEFAVFIKAEIGKWAPVIRKAGVTAN